MHANPKWPLNRNMFKHKIVFTRWANENDEKKVPKKREANSRWMHENSLITKVNGSFVFFFCWSATIQIKHMCMQRAVRVFMPSSSFMWPSQIAPRYKSKDDAAGFFRSFICYICTKWNSIFFSFFDSQNKRAAPIRIAFNHKTTQEKKE